MYRYRDRIRKLEKYLSKVEQLESEILEDLGSLDDKRYSIAERLKHSIVKRID
jgi:hypothetical protein